VVLAVVFVAMLFGGQFSRAWSQQNQQDETPSLSLSEGNSSTAPEEEPTAPAYQEVTLEQYDLTVCLDPGNGGNDAGGTDVQGRTCAADNLTLAYRVAAQLQLYGVEVVMTRTADTSVTLSDRCAVANSRNADLFLSLHRSASSDSTVFGMRMWIQESYTEAEAQLAEALRAGFAQAEVQQVSAVEHGMDGSSTQSYYVCASTDMPAVQIDMGNLMNKTDNELFDAHLDQYAEVMADSIIQAWTQMGHTSTGSKTYTADEVEALMVAAENGTLEVVTGAKSEEPVDQEPVSDENTDGQWPQTGTTINRLNIRQEANASSARITTAADGQEVTVTDLVTNEAGEEWYAVSVTAADGTVYQGYCLASYIRFN
jgi:N-acetylmuramoyl-L-alanine amidase